MMDSNLIGTIMVIACMLTVGAVLILYNNSVSDERIKEAKAQDAKLNEQAKTECDSRPFYNNNFERCEAVGVRPL